MLSHDGDRHIHERIEDRTYNVETDVQYQLLEDGWEQKIAMRKIEAEDNRYVNHTAYWATFMAVENNDPRLIDHKEYSTAVKFKVKEQGSNKMAVEIERFQGVNEDIVV